MRQWSVHVLIDGAVVFNEHTVPFGEQETHKLHGRYGGTVGKQNYNLRQL